MNNVSFEAFVEESILILISGLFIILQEGLVLWVSGDLFS